MTDRCSGKDVRAILSVDPECDYAVAICGEHGEQSWRALKSTRLADGLPLRRGSLADSSPVNIDFDRGSNWSVYVKSAANSGKPR
jgi:hypothetical protein